LVDSRTPADHLWIGIALVTGLMAGKVLSFTGHRSQPYEDAEEFTG